MAYLYIIKQHTLYTAKQIAQAAAKLHASPRAIAEAMAAEFGVEFTSSSLNLSFLKDAGSYYIHVNGACVRISDHELPECYAWQYKDEERYEVRVKAMGAVAKAYGEHVAAFEAIYGVPVVKRPGQVKMTVSGQEYSEARAKWMAEYVQPQEVYVNVSSF